jgi:phage gpG-like protein
MIEIMTKAAEIKLRNLTAKAKDQSELIRVLGAVAVANIKENFNTESWDGVAWDPLNAAYALRKARSPGVIQKKLQYSGRLINSIRYFTIGRDAISVGSSIVYAASQNSKRQFLAPTAKNVEGMQAIVRNYFEKT